MRSAALADTLGRLACILLMNWRRLTCNVFARRTWWRWLKEVEAGGNDVKNPFYRVEKKLSVVQTSVEVTESSLI